MHQAATHWEIAHIWLHQYFPIEWNSLRFHYKSHPVGKGPKYQLSEVISLSVTLTFPFYKVRCVFASVSRLFIMFFARAWLTDLVVASATLQCSINWWMSRCQSVRISEHPYLKLPWYFVLGTNWQSFELVHGLTALGVRARWTIYGWGWTPRELLSYYGVQYLA